MSDTATMNLVDFMRTCLDEDEDAWKMVRSREVRILVTEFRGRPLFERMLEDVAAKRRILDEYTESASRTVAHGAPSNAEVRTAALADVIQVLAEAYADRPGWREEWRA